MPKKKLLIFHPALAPYRVDFFNSLNEHYNAQFYFFNENLLNQNFDQDQLKRRINFKCNYLSEGVNLPGRTLRSGIWNVIKKEEPDIIISAEYNLINFSIGVYKLVYRNNFKIYTMCDDNITAASNASYLRKISRSLQLRFLDGLILTHAEIVNWYKTKFNTGIKLIELPIIRKESIYQKQLIISQPIAKAYQDKYQLKDKKVLLFVGRLTAVKNLEQLLKAFKNVHQKQKETVLILVGSGDLEHQLKTKVIEYELQEAVLIPGRFENENLFAWYLTAGVFILPSISEPFGAVTNEALLAGNYVLVSNVAGSGSLIKNGLNGNTFSPHNIEEMESVMLAAIKKEVLFENQSLIKDSRMYITYENTINNIVIELN